MKAFISYENKKYPFYSNKKTLKINGLEQIADKLAITQSNILSNHKNFHVKIEGKWNKSKCSLIHEIKIYNLLQPLHITPKLIKYENIKVCDLFDDNNMILDTYYYHYLVIEKYGESLWDLYSDNNWEGANIYEYYDAYIKALEGNTNKEELNVFNIMFPPCIPNEIREQVKIIYQKMVTVGYLHQDMHAGNFLVKDGIVKVIDFN